MLSICNTTLRLVRRTLVVAWFCLAIAGCAQICVAADEHPIDPALRLVNAAAVKAQNLRDYTATFIKRERLDGELTEYEFSFIKIRHDPFSVYVHVLRPEKVRGRECIYIEGQNDGKMLAHENGSLGRIIGMVSLSPNGVVAMQGQKYPITNIGIKHLALQSVLDLKAKRSVPTSNIKVRIYDSAKVDGRETTCIVVDHPVRQEDIEFHSMRIFIDDELGVPTRFEGYGWPAATGGKPPLVEEYHYRNLKTDQGLTDFDFDAKNPDYAFD